MPQFGAWNTALIADAYGGDEAEEINARTGCIMLVDGFAGDADEFWRSSAAIIGAGDVSIVGSFGVFAIGLAEGIEEKVEIFDANNTRVNVMRDAILRGWQCEETGLWKIPLMMETGNNNTDMVLVKEPPTNWLPWRPSNQQCV